MTAEEIVAMGNKEHPGVRYSIARDGNSVAAWHKGAWVPVAGKGIDGHWYSLTANICVNGKPAFDPAIYGSMETRETLK